MTKLITILKSRTNWTLVIMFAFNVLNAFGHYLPADLTTLINGILTSLAVYFKINPSQNYNA